MREAVKLQSRKVRGHDTYTITVPKDFVKQLGWAKGDILFAEIVEHEGKRGIFYYKP